MDVPPWLAFTGGVLVGLALSVPLRRLLHKLLHDVPIPTITGVVCLSDGQIRIDGTLDPAPAGMTLVALHSQVYDDPAHVVPDSPLGEGATTHGTTFPLFHTLPGGLSGPNDLVAVWAEYQSFTKRDYVYQTCPAGAIGPVRFGKVRVVPAAVPEQLEAIPRAYRISPASPKARSSGGLAATLVGALPGAPDTVLRYVPEASTPVEPFWRARGGPEPILEWTLRLLHRSGGFGAVLSAVYPVQGREVRLTWVTSDWRFHAANRLMCESDEADGPALLVRPA